MIRILELQLNTVAVLWVPNDLSFELWRPKYYRFIVTGTEAQISTHYLIYFHIMIFLAFAVDGSEWKTKFG